MTAVPDYLARQAMGAVAGIVYPGGSGARLPILVYHRVLQHADPLMPDTLDVKATAEHFSVLARYFNVLPLDEAVEMAAEGLLPRRAVAITFDDGYRDNFDVALPLLRKFGLPATVYVATSFLDGGRMFNDTVLECVRRLPDGKIDLKQWGLGQRVASDAASRIALAHELSETLKAASTEQRAEACERLAWLIKGPLPDDLMMTSEQVTSISREGVAIGGHTVNHPALALVDTETARREISENRAALTTLTGRAPRSFAYPFGSPAVDFSSDSVDVVRACGYSSAVTMSWAVATVAEQRYQLPRFGPSERSGAGFLARMLKMFRHYHPVLLPEGATAVAH